MTVVDAKTRLHALMERMKDTAAELQGSRPRLAAERELDAQAIHTLIGDVVQHAQSDQRCPTCGV